MIREHKTLIFTGAFLLCFVPASADQVFQDDGIFDGSLCVGQDCVNGEEFGFSTVVLKENNLRIRFTDTSSSAAFPSGDWEIVINDSQNGGDSHFSIHDLSANTTPFRVDGNAPTDAIRVGPTGRVGLGTGNPATELHVVGADTPSLRLEQNGSEGWTPYSWDTAANEGGYFVRDTIAQSVPFRIEAGAVDGAMVIAQDGNLTIAGTLAQGSSRAIKNVFPLVATDILAKLKTVEVARWQYKNDSHQASHVGPMAEEFYSTFGLGADNKHITSSDVAGVAMVSVQALAATIETQDSEIALLRKNNEALEARLLKLEKRLSK